MITNSNLLLAMTSAVSGTVFAQTLAVGNDPLLERLGVAGFLVVTLLFILRYFMGVVDKKDQQIQIMVREQNVAFEKNAAVVVDIVEKGHEVQAKTTDAINRLASILETRAGLK